MLKIKKDIKKNIQASILTIGILDPDLHVLFGDPLHLLGLFDHSCDGTAHCPESILYCARLCGHVGSDGRRWTIGSVNGQFAGTAAVVALVGDL